MSRTEDEILEHFGGSIDNALNTVFANLQDDEDNTSPITQTSSFLNPYNYYGVKN